MLPDAPVGLRERRKLATRQRILDAARASFVVRGYAGTTMDQVAVDAQVSRSTLFNYFARKDELLFSGLLGDLRSLISEWIEDCRRRGLSAAATLTELLARLGAWFEAQPAERAALTRCSFEAGGPLMPGWFDSAALFAEILSDGVRSGELPADLDVEIASRLLLDAYLGVRVRWALAPEQVHLTAELATVLSMCLRGLVAPATGRSG